MEDSMEPEREEIDKELKREKGERCAGPGV